MSAKQLHSLKRIGTCLALGLVLLSIGLMVIGWTVPRRSAFELGVLGYQIFPIAVVAVIIRIIMPLLIGNRIISSLNLKNRNTVVKPARGSASNSTQLSDEQGLNADRFLTTNDPMGNPLKKTYTNTSPAHMSPLSNPDGYIPDYDAVFNDDD